MPQPQHNLEALLIGTGEFMFSENAASVADTLLKGFRTFGNVKAYSIEMEKEFVEHVGSYRGVRRVDRRQNSKAGIKYLLKCDEFTFENLRVLMGGETGAELLQTVKSAVSADALAFAAPTPSGTAKWYDIKVAGVRVRKATAVTIATLVEGTDFEVDLDLGRIRFLTNQTTSRTPVVTAPAITTGQADAYQTFTPLRDMMTSGFGRLTLFDQDDDNNLVLDHVDFACDVSIESMGEINGTDFTEFTVAVTVKDPKGTIHTRSLNNT